MSIKEVEKLLAGGDIREAGRHLGALVSKNPENDHLWYLKGMISLKARNYDGALESFTKAHMLSRKPSYFRMKGIAHLEMFELDDAIESFEDALEQDENDVLSLFFIAICYMFFDSPKSMEYMKRAYRIDRKRTRQLLNNFYASFFSGNRVDDKTKEKIRESLQNI